MTFKQIISYPPVLIIGYRRLNTLKKVLESTYLNHKGEIFIFLDVPKEEHQDIKEECSSLRDWVKDFAHGKKSITVHVSEYNVGCAFAIPSAINWVLNLGHEELIILEDDCLPHDSFFKFMYEMLDHYKNDNRIMMISGNQFLPSSFLNEYKYSYYYSRYIHTWGWATWKRAWVKYDHEMNELLSPFIMDNFCSILPSNDEQQFYTNIWKEQLHNPLDTSWDSRWLLACLLARGLCICPNKNLVRNIGFGAGSTHTEYASKYHVVPLQEIEFPLKHPHCLVEWRKADKWWFNHLISKRIIPRLRRYFLRVNPNNVLNEA